LIQTHTHTHTQKAGEHHRSFFYLISFITQLARGALVLTQFGRKGSRKNKQLAGGGAASLASDGSPASPARTPSLLKQEVGGAMAAVEAAGRTVFKSTKQVVSAVAGTLNIVEAREETLHEAWGSSADTKDDSVILTEILRKGPGEETVVVVSTKRVVCVEYLYRGSGAPEVQLLWQAPLKAIRGLALKSTPLALVFHIDRHAAKAPGAGGAGGGAAGSTAGMPPTSFMMDSAEEAEAAAAAAAAESGPARTLLARHGGGGGTGGEEDQHHIVQKRILGDWRQDNVALLRVYNLVQCLLGRSEEVETEMGYGFGIPCESGGFQFGVWEFAPPDGADAPVRLTAHQLQQHARASGPWRSPLRPIDAAAMMTGGGEDAGLWGGSREGAWPIFQLLERVRWLRVELEDDPLQEMFAAICTISPSSSASSRAATPISVRTPAAASRGSLTGAKPGYLVSGGGGGGGGGGIRSSLLGLSNSSAAVAAEAQKAPATRLSSQASSTSSVAGGVLRSSTVEEEGMLLSPPTGAGAAGVRAPVSAANGGAGGGSGGRQVVVEEGILTRLMDKIDSLEARLREFEHEPPQEKGKGKKGGKR